MDLKATELLKEVQLPYLSAFSKLVDDTECFHEKDYLNHRYHGKRCLYLCVVKKYLTSSPLVHKVEWSTLQNEARKPILIVHPATKHVEVPGFVVRLIPTATSLFSTSKLNPERNNVRALNQGGISQATPKYNSSILEDMLMEETTESMKKIFLGWKELGEALVLLKVWARQRTSIYAHDCLNGFLLSVILANLARRNRINNSMKTMQIVRVTLTSMATPSFWTRGLYLQMKDQNAISKEKTQSNQKGPVVKGNQHATFNLAFRMSTVATLTLKCFEKCGDGGGFEEIFMTKIDFPAKYDHCIRLNLEGRSEVFASGYCLDDECWRVYEQKVHDVLSEGLSDRVKLVRVLWRNIPSKYLVENGLSKFSSEPLLVGISLNSLEKSSRVIDIGPNPENKEEALKFRKFWGEKAELRRFKDVWESKQWERHLVLKKITEYVLTRHLSLPKENITNIVDQLDFSLVHGATDPISHSASLLEAFDVLSKRLRLIQDIPLKVSAVQPLDSAFRFTSVFPPEPHPLANEKGGAVRLSRFTSSCIQPLELEGSGNWPMDEVAIEKTKCAFLIKIGESLKSNWGMMCTATEDSVDVLMSGYAFRLKIWHERGLSLLKRETESDQVKRVYSTDKELFFRSQHSNMINGLQSRYPVYGPVARLAKRWVASHLFSTCLVEEAIELLVAYLFLKPLPYEAPSSRITGFLRFLLLLSDYDWTFAPLIVDINEDLGTDGEKEITENFMLARKAYESNAQDIKHAMFVATGYDRSSEAWTRFSPNSSELKRLVAYARSSANLLTKLVLEDHSDSLRWECLFRTPLNNFDAVVLLHRDKLPHPQRLLFPSELKQGLYVARGSPSKIFHPFLLHEELKGSAEELRNKLLVDFDPLKCFLGDIEKRGLEGANEEEPNPTKLLKGVGEAGKGDDNIGFEMLE
ncbi:hypothetical protein F8388_019908, partial [Cannabis sativa]